MFSVPLHGLAPVPSQANLREEQKPWKDGHPLLWAAKDVLAGSHSGWCQRIQHFTHCPELPTVTTVWQTLGETYLRCESRLFQSYSGIYAGLGTKNYSWVMDFIKEFSIEMKNEKSKTIQTLIESRCWALNMRAFSGLATLILWLRHTVLITALI